MTNDVDAGFSAAWREKAARSMYVTSRHMLLGEVLRRARAGTLDQDWREHLTTYFPRLARAAGHHVALVERELIEPSPQPWEPYVAGGHWREALDAWYSDTLALETYYEAEHFAGPPRPPSDSESGVDWLAWYASGQQQQIAAADHSRQNQQRNRDRFGASYRAGLAAGGIDITGWAGTGSASRCGTTSMTRALGSTPVARSPTSSGGRCGWNSC
jgi:hypothetical protein